MLIEVFGISSEQLIGFSLTFIRILAVVAVAPLFGSRTIPARVKIVLAIFLTIIIWPILDMQKFGNNLQFKSLFTLTFKEVIIGLFLGFNAKFLFEAFNFAGRLISQQMGLMMAELVNPESGAQVSPIENILSLMAILFFIYLEGHIFIITAIHKSFLVIPVASLTLIRSGAGEKMLSMFNNIFILGLKFASPVVAIIFLIEICMGILARIVPQMNIFFIGLPIRLGVGLLILTTMIPLSYLFFNSIFKIWQLDLNTIINKF